MIGVKANKFNTIKGSEAAEGRWGSMAYVWDYEVHDGPSCWFVVMIRE